jgi:hypothetical protein
MLKRYVCITEKLERVIISGCRLFRNVSMTITKVFSFLEKS